MNEILIPKKNVVLDASMLSDLMGCGRKMDLRYQRHMIPNKGRSTAVEQGSTIHKFMEVYYKDVISGAPKGAAEMNAHGAAELYAQSDEVRNATPDDIAWAIQTCHDYLQYYKNDFWIPLEVETVKSKVLYEDDEIRVLWKAKLDIIVDNLQGIYPMDHKSMKQRRDTVSLNNQFIGQCILMETRMMFLNKIGLQKTLKPEERFLRVAVNYTADVLNEWQGVTLPYWAKIYLMYAESEFWPPNLTHCESKYGTCMFIDVCTADRGLREETLGAEFTVGEPWNPED